jgi:hypothetical protein
MFNKKVKEVPTPALKLYHITSRYIFMTKNGRFKEEWGRHQNYNVLARCATDAIDKCKFEPGEILDEIELLNEDIIV